MNTAVREEALAGWSVGELLARAHDRVVAPAPIEGWVVGCVTGLRHTRGHLFFDLAEAVNEPVRRKVSVPVTILGRSAERVLHTLTGAGVELANGLQVRLWGRLDLYVPRARLEFVASAVDPATTVGAASLGRRRLLRQLQAEHLLEANGRCIMPALPLRVGIVGPPGAGRDDVVAALRASGYGWQLTCATVSTHGPAAAAAIAWGVGTTWRRDVDVVLIVRGGGAAIELSVFDDERVARAVARCPRPVWVAVGHSGDRSVADACAQRSFPTPSAAAAALVAIAASVEQGLDDAAARIGRSAAALLMACSDRLGSTSSAVTSLGRAIVVKQEVAVNLIETTIVGLGRAEAADRRARSLTVVAAVAVLLLAAVVLLVALGVKP